MCGLRLVNPRRMLECGTAMHCREAASNLAWRGDLPGGGGEVVICINYDPCQWGLRQA